MFCELIGCGKIEASMKMDLGPRLISK